MNDDRTRDRFMREPEVHNITGLSRTTRWRLEREGKFPRRRAISDAAVGWLESEIDSWVAARQTVETVAA